MNFRLALLAFCVTHVVLLAMPAWALGFYPESGYWAFGTEAEGIRMSWYGQALGAGVAFFVGLLLAPRPPPWMVGAAILLNLVGVVSLQIAHAWP